jgi:acylaminoacyl-peptidase
MALVHATLDGYPDIIDPTRVGCVGGSHGGFLVGHLIGQHPEMFKVAAMRNPVTNIAGMVTASDIPDW